MRLFHSFRGIGGILSEILIGPSLAGLGRSNFGQNNALFERPVWQAFQTPEEWETGLVLAEPATCLNYFHKKLSPRF
jgi:hypothetical protein